MLSASADHVAAFVLHPRAVDRTEVVCSLLFAPTRRSRTRRSTPRDAAELWDLVNRQDWAICESVQRGMSSRAYRHGWFAPMEDDSLDIRRWLLPRLERGPDDVSSVSTTSSSGSAALGSAAAWELARRGHRVVGLERFELGHARGASHDTSRILRHSYHTPAYVRLTQEAYADWARLERESGAAAGHHGRRARPVPARTRRSRRSTTSQSLDEVGIAYERARRRPGDGALAAAAAARRARSALYQADAAIVPAGARHRGAAGRRPGGSAPSCATTPPVLGLRGPRASRRRGDHADGEVDAAAGVVVTRRRVDQRRARPPRRCRCRSR